MPVATEPVEHDNASKPTVILQCFNEGTLAMEVQDPKPLPLGMNLSCYACESAVAAYLCRYTIDELSVQVCLCRDCMNLDTNALLKNTIGIDDLSDLPAAR